MRRICSADEMPPESTVRGWVNDDVHGFSAQYAHARNMGMDALADEILDIADDGRNDVVKEMNSAGEIVERVNFDHINRSKLRVDARKWLMSKIAPKKYGDKIEVDGNIKAEMTLPEYFGQFAEQALDPGE